MEILLFDNHEMFSKSLAMALETFSDVHQVVSLATVEELEAQLLRKRPDVLLLDIRLENENGLYIGEDLLQGFPGLNIIFLSGFDSEEYQQRAMLIGAKAFVNKNDSLDHLMQTIRLIVFGTDGYRETAAEAFEMLTQMEITVLQALADGLKQENIAHDLKITRRTVNTHVRNILLKMEVNSSMQAVLKAIELGLISNNINK